jgi:hypothetical protein
MLLWAGLRFWAWMGFLAGLGFLSGLSIYGFLGWDYQGFWVMLGWAGILA